MSMANKGRLCRKNLFLKEKKKTPKKKHIHKIKDFYTFFDENFLYCQISTDYKCVVFFSRVYLLLKKEKRTE